MAQLIKLRDYVSRYEQNIVLYPSRFVRLKKQKWEGIKKAYTTNDRSVFHLNNPMEEEWIKEKPTFLEKMKTIINRKKTEEEFIDTIDIQEEIQDRDEDDLQFHYDSNQYKHPHSIDELKLQFLNQLFHFQLKWASSTLTEISTVKRTLYYDDLLKYYLQRFPDTFLVLYQPIIQLKQAPIELDTVIITPTEIWCIHLLEAENSAVFVGSNEKFWIKKKNDQEKKLLSPVISINRTESIVRSILEKYQILLPIQKVILTRNGYIDFPTAPYDLTIVEKRNYEEWFQKMRNHHSPIKAIQLKAAESLLQYGLTVSSRRYEWDKTDQ
ncbi:nuclease-related domain-containing protein [Bacillus sp. B1-b2]|uniref:nuclease-related domain-containing protein n=1 Tax=Bacillus sp. B1-b2 TaxID=2653201 RepID=UPI0012617749|nr:nuclease-related domain-containing protein [Bacillus sp. B1-b2]KAB7666788.1 NERD domain-containing protein [Bacillus sp. B1-b2]